MGVTPGTLYNDTAAGWTVVTPSVGTIVHYVASAANGGSDSNDGLAGTVGGGHGPYLTLQKGMDNCRNGQADWLLLRMGDTWTSEQLFPRGSGISNNEPWLISSYDPAFPGQYDPAGSSLAHPLLKCTIGFGAGFESSAGAGGGAGGNNTALIGIDFYAYERNPLDPGFNLALVLADVPINGVSLSNQFTWFLIENCVFRFFYQNIGFTGPLATYSSNMIIRRNVIVDCYSVAHNGGDGIHPGATNGVVIRENVLDHNGWEATYTDPNTYAFTHQIYASQYAAFGEYDTTSGLCGVIDVTGNIMARDSSQCQFRSGGNIINNLWIYNPDCMNCSLSQASTVQYNVVLHGAKNPGTNSNCGLFSSVANKYDYSTTSATPSFIDMSNNIVAHSTRDGASSFGYEIVNPQSATFSNNIVYDWAAPLINHFQGGIIALNAPTGSNSGATAFPTFTGFIDDGLITFAITAANATVGATYTASGLTFTVNATITGGTSLVCNGHLGLPAAFGTLIKATGTGDATITYSAFSRAAGRVLTVSSISGTPLALGQQITGVGIPAACYNIMLGSGVGGLGTYQLIVNDIQIEDGGRPGFRLLIAPETMSIANWVLPLTGGTGTDAVGFIKVSGGAVTSVEVNPLHGPNMVPATFGINYTVGDSLTAAVPGTSGFAVTVASVRKITDTGTVQCPTNQASCSPATSYPHPERSLLTYDTDVLGGPGTFAHYIALARAQSKQNWNPLIPANAVNTYVRAGFGISGGGSSAVDNRRYKYVAFNA